MPMKLVVESESYIRAVDTIISLVGTEVDCALRCKDGKVVIEASNDEAWLQVPLKVESANGSGKAFTKVEFLKIISPGRAKSITMEYDGENHIAVQWGRAKGVIGVLDEDDVMIRRPEAPVKVSAVVPLKLIRFATGATAFKPLIDSSAPNAIISVDDKEFNISSYDTYIGTHYGTRDEQVRVKQRFDLLVEMDYWRAVVTKLGSEGNVRMGADDHNFRVKTDTFDLYHAVIQEDTQDVKEVITTLRSEGEHLAVVEFDGNAVTEAIDATKGIIRSADKDGARFFITLKEDVAILSAESSAGEMEAEFDIEGFDGKKDVEFRVSSDAFADTLKLTRDEALKYGPVRLTVLKEYLVMESTKVPASSISPVLQD
jgi:hypothetical protein